jgi:acid phosphatase family membrane protein YuiD
MPSSHTPVTTLTIGMGLYADGSSMFAVTLLFASLHVRSAGLRQEVGNQARLLNDLVEELRHTHHVDPKRLKELVGHTWGEVAGGFVFGLIVSAVAYR